MAAVQTLRVAALQGLGIIQQPDVLLDADIRAGRLVEVLGDYILPTRPMHIVYLLDRRLTPKVKAFIDFVLQRLGGGGRGEAVSR
jgi:DNA-binding transcriptional LysR family regulator